MSKHLHSTRFFGLSHGLDHEAYHPGRFDGDKLDMAFISSVQYRYDAMLLNIPEQML